MKNKKVVIIGGGVSGLSSAVYLKDKGYNDITIFEKENQVGGQVHTFFKDEKSYDMAAFYVTGNSPLLFKMLHRFEGDTLPLETINLTILNNKTGNEILQQIGIFNLLFELFIYTLTYFYYIWLSFSWKQLFSYENYRITNLHLIPPNKLISIQKYGTYFSPAGFINQFMIPSFKSFISTSFGDTAPITFFLKVLNPFRIILVLISSSGGWYLSNGYQTLWKKISQLFKIHLNAEVTQIDPIQKYLVYNSIRFDYDILIVTISAEIYTQLINFNDKFYTDTITRLDRSTTVISNYTYVAHISNLAKKIQIQSLDSRLKTIFWWIKPYMDTDTYVFLLDLTNVQGSPLNAFITDITTLGGTDIKILQEKQFDISVVKAVGAQNGFYVDLQRIQGVYDIYFVGQNYISDVIIESLLESTQKLINTYFR
jgi:hypothetical protein